MSELDQDFNHAGGIGRQAERLQHADCAALAPNSRRDRMLCNDLHLARHSARQSKATGSSFARHRCVATDDRTNRHTP
jgi:hypothetical protein